MYNEVEIVGRTATQVKTMINGKAIKVTGRINEDKLPQKGRVREYARLTDVIPFLQAAKEVSDKYLYDLEMDEVPKANAAEVDQGFADFHEIALASLSDNMVKYVVANAEKRKDGMLFKRRILRLCVLNYVDTLSSYYELTAQNVKEDTIKIEIRESDMMNSPIPEEYKEPRLSISHLGRIDAGHSTKKMLEVVHGK